jgi:hypothetical protein
MPNPRGNPNIANYGNRFSKDNQPGNKPGPRPSRIRAYIQENDLSTNDIRAAIGALAEMTAEELAKVKEDEQAPVLLRGFAFAMMVEMQKGALVNLEMLLNRAFGKPKESMEVTGDISYEIKTARKKADAESTD